MMGLPLEAERKILPVLVQAASVAGMAAAAKEAVAALTALGYTNMEASKAVKKVEITENMSVEDILKASLKYLSFL